MSKIICDVCGTSYSDNVDVCPICGCSNSLDDQDYSMMPEETDLSAPYHHVRGGRFSKSNVRKRIRNVEEETEEPAEEPVEEELEEEKPASSSNKGLVIAIVLLILAILAVGVYIYINFLAPVLMPEQEASDVPSATAAQTVQQTIPCTKIVLDNLALTFTGSGASRNLISTLTPINTTDIVRFDSLDEAVATVDQNGLITAIGYGETTIVVTCGEVTAECMVIVNEDSPDFSLNRDEIKFYAVGEEWTLYDGPVAVTDITWASDDPSVATVDNGKVVAVGSGITTIYADYSGQMVSCIVVCEFAEETEPPTEATVSEENYTKPYRLKNLFSPYDNDVIISKGESFTLVLIDAYGNRIQGVTWSVEDPECCSVENGTVTGLASGKTTNVIATFNGKTYTCYVRVK